jgi:hypothetical protein
MTMGVEEGQGRKQYLLQPSTASLKTCLLSLTTLRHNEPPRHTSV